MKQILALSALLVCLTPMVAEAAVSHDSKAHNSGAGDFGQFKALLVKTAFDQQGRRKNNDDHRSNWNNDNGDSNNGRDDRRDDRANQARNLARSYRNVVEVQNVTPDGGPYFHARVRTSDGRRLDLRINADTGEVREE